MSGKKTNKAADKQFGFYAKKNECLFPNPIMPHFKDSMYPEFLKKLASLNDDRVLAIVTALVVEHLLTRILENFLPTFQDEFPTDDSKGPNLGLQIKILRSLGFIPPSLLDAADRIREIRNRFAHKLTIEKFDDLDNKLMNKMNALFDQALPGIQKTIRTETFRLVSFYCIAGLDMACKTVTVLRKEIEEPEFIQNVEKRIHIENNEKWKEMMSRTPISERIEGGWLNKTYSDGDVVKQQVPPKQE